MQESSGAEGRELLLPDARRVCAEMVAHLRLCAGVVRAEPAGALRRWEETVSAVSLVAGCRGPRAAVVEHFLKLPTIARVEARGEADCAVTLSDGARASLSCVPDDEFWAALHHATGPAAYVEKLAGVARGKGFTLTPKALERGGPPKRLTLKSEEDIYDHLGMQYVPPELREGGGEAEAALAHELPEDLLRLEDLRGMVHCHTVYSDGSHGIEEMARAAEALGMDYITITDHSPSVEYVRGVTLDQLKRQWDEIDEVQSRVKIKLLRGTESDILADGSLDYPDSVLEKFDIVIASIHTRGRMDEGRMTRRLLRAMRHPLFKVWGHALGRLLLQRPPFACRVEEVLDAIAESRAAVEINGDPRRLDMEPRWVREARGRGIRFVVSADAHSVEALEHVGNGVAAARRGRVRRGEVLNTLDAAGFQKAVRPSH